LGNTLERQRRNASSVHRRSSFVSERPNLNVVYIGADARTAEIALLATHLRWPEVTPLVAATAGEGLELVEQELPDLVLLCPDFTDWR
jgi:hypothetical protein